MQTLKCTAALALALGVSGCPFELKYTVGGTVSGLEGAGLVIQDSTGHSLTVTGNGAFSFGTGIAKGTPYSVTVTTQPTSSPTNTCTARNNTGTITNFNVVNVLVTCAQAGRFVYVANQTDGTISALQINTTDPIITAIPGSPTVVAGGRAPTALAVDADRTHLYVVNTSSNNVAQFSINYLTGFLTSTGASIPTGNAPSAIAMDPGNRFLFVANSTDNTVSSFSLSGGTVTPVGSPYPVGIKPLALSTDPGGNFLYVANYSDGTVSGFAVDPTTGILTALAGSPFVGAGSGSGAGSRSILVAPSGTFAYVANELVQTISAYSITPGTGTLVGAATYPTSTNPEALAITPGGGTLYAANVTSIDQVTPYTFTPSTGALTAGAPVATLGVLPTSLAVDQSGGYAFAVNNQSNDLSVFTVNPASGALTAVKGSPFFSGGGARAVAVD